MIERSQALAALTQEEFDVVVVGGGITGAGVALDAAAHATSAKLAHSSGNPKTDAAAVAAARSAQYAFTLPPGCKPQATTYRLELTYK